MIQFAAVEHLILFVYILIFSTGFTALAAIVFLCIRIKSKILRPLLILQIVFIAAGALVAIYFYLSNVLNLVGDKGPLDVFFLVLSTILNSSLYYLLAQVVAKLPTKTDASKRQVRFTKGFCYTASAMMLLGFFVKIIPAFNQQSSSQNITLSSIWTVIIYVLGAITIGSVGFTLMRNPASGEQSSIQFMLKYLSYCYLAFVPLGLIEYVVDVLANQPYQPLSLEYLFYIGNNVVLILTALRSLQPNKETSTAFAVIQSSDPTRFALTQREQEMARLIARGLSNKEIAGELNISVATVRTHIYNLFQKTGVQSRIELLNKLSE